MAGFGRPLAGLETRMKRMGTDKIGSKNICSNPPYPLHPLFPFFRGIILPSIREARPFRPARVKLFLFKFTFDILRGIPENQYKGVNNHGS
jgi:hypothetical protein